jgi:tetratricopeptide (TPR) repeat protein
MSELHYDEDTFLTYLEDRTAVDDADDLQMHLIDCAPCRRLFDSVQEFFGSLDVAEVWDADEPMLVDAEPDPAKLEAFLSHARRLLNEDQTAQRLIGPLLSRNSATWRAEIELTPEMQTAAALRLLAEQSRKAREVSPARSFEIAEVATHFAELLPIDRYTGETVFQVRGTCWFEQANALRYLGRHKEALKALDRAEQCFSHSAADDFELAKVAYVRAILMLETDRHSEAQRLARISADSFLTFGDLRRYSHARMLEGGIYFERNDWAQARDVFMALLKPVRASGDTDTLARLFNNVGQCLTRLNDLDSAGTYLLQAMLLYQDLGNEVGKVKARWALGRLLVTSGKFEEGVVRLRQTRSEFHDLAMEMDAGLVSLDLAEALLALEQADEVPEILSNLVALFSREGSNVNAGKALAYLKEAVGSSEATPATVRYVREYLEELPRQPARAFAPPPS